MADAFTTQAGQGIDQAGAQALAQVANSGSAAKQAINTAAANNAALRTQALRNAMSYAALRGAPTSVVDANNATIGAPVDINQTSLNDMAANYGADNAAQGSAANTFFQGAKASLPAADEAYKATAANDVAKVQAAQASAAAGMQSKELANQLAELKLQQAQTANTTPASIIKKLGGAQIAGDTINNAVVPAANAGAASFNTPAPQTRSGLLTQVGQAAGVVGTKTGQKIATSDAFVPSLQAQVGNQIGLSPETVQALASASSAADQAKALANQGKTQANTASSAAAASIAAQNAALRDATNAVAAGIPDEKALLALAQDYPNLTGAQIGAIYKTAKSPAGSSVLTLPPA